MGTPQRSKAFDDSTILSSEDNLSLILYMCARSFGSNLRASRQQVRSRVSVHASSHSSLPVLEYKVMSQLYRHICLGLHTLLTHEHL